MKNHSSSSFIIGGALAFTLWAPFHVTPHHNRVGGVIATGSTCLSWEASFKSMAAEHEDWGDLDPVACDGLSVLEEEEMVTIPNLS